MRVLVTGNEGCIGSILVPMLRQAGHDVVGLDTGLFRECALKPVARPRTIRKDVRDIELEDLGGIEGVIHLAALNGCKMMLGGRSFFDEQIQELGRSAAEGAFASGEGRIVDEPMIVPYVDRLVQDYALGRELAVVWDAGNGATGEALQAVAARLPGRHTILFAEIDGHHPGPTIPANLENLIHKVKDVGAEVGIAFDDDGERIGVVDGRGRILFGDQLLQPRAIAHSPNGTTAWRRWWTHPRSP